MAELEGDEKRRYVRAMFSRIASRYDLMNTLMTGGVHHRWRSKAAARASTGLSGVGLDIGTGTGDLAIALARRPGIEGVVALDLVPGMLARARAKAGPNVHPVVGDALSLPFPDNHFCCVTSGFTLRNMPDVPESLREMARVTRPGGRVVCLELTPLGASPFRPLFRLYFHRLLPLMGRLIAGDASAYTYLPRSVERFLTMEGLTRLFADVGLKEGGHQALALGTVAIHWGVKG